MRKSIAVFLLAAIAAILPPAASATSIITVPPGLNPGDQYRLVFPTQELGRATSSDIADYNAFVTTDALVSLQLTALGTTWTAIGSTATVNAEDNTSTNPAADPSYPIYNLAGDLVASGNDALWNSASTPMSAKIDVSPIGHVLTQLCWTGTLSSGIVDVRFPLGAHGGPPGSVEGQTSVTGHTWIDNNNTQDQTKTGSYYGISGVLTVPTPEPSTMVLACLAAAGMVILAIRRRRHSIR